jgi:NADH dehydrogenase FAD-containing subunit
MRILLAGGGHTHLIAAPLLARRGHDAAEIAMLAPSRRLLYSGMMPGWLAGQYRFDDCVIDLRRVCELAGIEWVEDELVDVDFARRCAIGAAGRRHRYDLLSLNVGSENRFEVEESDPQVVVLGTKPFAGFVDGWERWCQAVRRERRPRQCVVVGGGAAAVEIAFALDALRRREAALAGSEIRIVSSGGRLLAGRSAAAAALARRSLAARAIPVALGLHFAGVRGRQLLLMAETAGDAPPDLQADLVVVATGALPPGWLAQAARRDGVPVAADGGIAVDATMQSVGDATVFACGDCAAFVETRVDRSGVMALKQGAPLAQSIAARARGGCGPGRFDPPSRSLALLNRADGSAIGDWGPIGFAGRWAWRWKDRIDRRFIGRFR